MKQKLLFSLLLALIGVASYADPTAAFTTTNITVCPGNSAQIIITGTPNITATITTPSVIPNTITINIGPAGTGTFTTPILYETTSFTLLKIRLIGSNVDTYINQTTTVTVISSGCPSIATDFDPSNLVINCNPGQCRTFTATPTTVASTTSYGVSSIPFCPEPIYPGQTVNQVDVTQTDDVWSSPIALPFNFSFFNQNYNSCQISTNGILTFNAQTPNTAAGYQMNGLDVPNAQFIHKNAIFGVFQDTDTRTFNQASPNDVSVNWVIQGTYPCRKLIVNFHHLGLFECNQALGTQDYQIVLHEVSNIIDVYVQNRARCASWENGAGVVGIINASGTLGYTPPGRNTNDSWAATNEAWRFSPSGPNVPMTVQWYEGMTPVGSGPTITVCPTVTSSYFVESSFQISGIPYVITSSTKTIVVNEDQTESPADLNVCYDPTEIYTVDLTANTTAILASVDPNQYEVKYFTNLEDAQNYANPINEPANFAFTQNQTIYAGIVNYSYDCIYVKSFNIGITPLVAAPIGESPQTLFAGQTLADVVVTGTNIQWYDAPQDGNLLPITTVLQNGATYYATQSVNNCESRMAQSFRLVIVVNLGTDEFDNNAFSLYPNPASNLVTLTSAIADVKLDIFNILGQKMENRILNNGSNTIDLSNFTSGVYLFQMSMGGKTKTYKIVKN
ncbi:MAG: T9SS type A sorting domain-containing protein [Flavobacterium sp.]